MEPDLLVQRLAHADAKVRRVAIHDALRDRSSHAPRLVAHLAVERDERALLLLIRGLAGEPTAQAGLARLRDDPASSAAVAHAALLAFDTPP